MKSVLVALVLVLSVLAIGSLAFGYENGVRVEQDSKQNYTEFAGSRVDAGLYGAIGFFKAKEDYGMRLTIGPTLFKAEDVRVYALYNFSGTLANTYTVWNEFELAATYDYYGVSVGRTYGAGIDAYDTKFPVKFFLQLLW